MQERAKKYFLLMARKMRARAEEALTIADNYRDPETQRMMLEIAAGYQIQAERIETGLIESGGVRCERHLGALGVVRRLTTRQ